MHELQLQVSAVLPRLLGMRGTAEWLARPFAGATSVTVDARDVVSVGHGWCDEFVKQVVQDGAAHLTVIAAPAHMQELMTRSAALRGVSDKITFQEKL